MSDREERAVLQWYQAKKDAVWRSPVVEVPTVRSLEMDRAIDTLTDALVTFGREAGWIEELFGRDEVDLLEAARLDIFQRAKVPFRSWWAWQLAAESGHGRAWSIPCPDPKRSDIVALAAQGRELGFSVEPVWSDQVVLDTSETPESLPARLWDRLSSAVRRRIQAAKSPVDLPGGGGSQRILYEDFYPNNAHCLIPLYRGLEERSEIEQLYVSLRPKVDRELEEAGIPAYPLHRCPPRPASGDETDRFSWSAATAERIRRMVYRFSKEGWPAGWLPPTDRLRDAIAEAVEVSLQRAHDFAGRFRSVLEAYEPTTVVVSTDFSVDARVLELLARKRGIRSVSIQHGLFYEDVRPKYFLADVLCVWGEYHAEFLHALPDRDARVRITGSPKHDRLRRRGQDAPGRDRPLIVYASTPITISPGLSRNDYVKSIAEVVRTSRALPHCDFVIKLHPSEGAAFARDTCAQNEAGSNVRVTKDDDVYDLIEAGSAVVVVSSTLGYEALLMRRPVVLLNLTGEADWLPLAEDGVAPGVYEEGGLPEALEQVLRQPAGRIDTTRYWHPEDGALERCIRMIANEPMDGAYVNKREARIDAR